MILLRGNHLVLSVVILALVRISRLSDLLHNLWSKFHSFISALVGSASDPPPPMHILVRLKQCPFYFFYFYLHNFTSASIFFYFISTLLKLLLVNHRERENRKPCLGPFS